MGDLAALGVNKGKKKQQDSGKKWMLLVLPDEQAKSPGSQFWLEK